MLMIFLTILFYVTYRGLLLYRNTTLRVKSNQKNMRVSKPCLDVLIGVCKSNISAIKATVTSVLKPRENPMLVLLYGIIFIVATIIAIYNILN